MSAPERKEPAISERTSRLIAGAFAGLIVAAAFLVLAMLLGWGLVWLWGLLFG